MLIGSDSGRIVILEYNPTKNTFEKVHQETFGKSGTLNCSCSVFLYFYIFIFILCDVQCFQYSHFAIRHKLKARH